MVPGMSSQEESDTSDSQQDNSIIASTAELSKPPKNSDYERQTQRQSAGEKTQPEEVETEEESVPCEEENFNFKNPSEIQLDVRKDQDLSKDKNKTESTDPSKEKTEGTEQKDEMVIGVNEPEENKNNDQTIEVQLNELSKDIENTEVADEEMKTEDVEKSKQPNDTSKIEEDSPVKNNIDEDISNNAKRSIDLTETCDIITEKSEVIIEDTASSVDVKCLEACTEKNVAQAIDNADVVEKSGVTYFSEERS